MLVAVLVAVLLVGVGVVGLRFFRTPEPAVDPLRVIQLIQTRPQEFRLDGGERLRFTAELPGAPERIGYVHALLARLGCDATAASAH